MSDQRYQPRRYSNVSFNSPSRYTSDGSFVLRRAFEWRIPVGGNAVQLLASVIQQEIRESVSRALSKQNMERSKFGHELNSRGIGTSADRLSGIFRGDDIMRLEDLGRFLTVLGPTCWPDGKTLTKALEEAYMEGIKQPIDKRLWEM